MKLKNRWEITIKPSSEYLWHNTSEDRPPRNDDWYVVKIRTFDGTIHIKNAHFYNCWLVGRNEVIAWEELC